MESRMSKYGVQASPERLKPPQTQKQVISSRKIPVVYYLCKNRHLEHPHFIEVPISNHDGLYLRDVIKRLVELRGKGMPSMYSWSCKRSYKNGFVWHDLSEDDLILPAQGNEYVLKGSELLDQSPPDRNHNAIINLKTHTQKALQPESPTYYKTQEASTSSSPPTTNIKGSETLPSLPPPPYEEEEQSPKRPLSPHSDSSGPSEFRICKASCAADAATQTDTGGKKRIQEKPRNTCTRGISTDDSSPDFEIEERGQNGTHGDEISPPPTTSTTSPSGVKMETLESLIRADARKMNSYRVLEEEDVYMSTGPKLRATNVLMQLITCGSLSEKDHNKFGLVPSYKPRLTHMKFPSPMFAGSMVLGELDCLSDNPKLMGLRMEDKEYFSGSLIETKKHKEEAGEGAATLKRSNSYNADRSCKSPDTRCDKNKLSDSSRSKCLPRTIKISANKQYKNGMMMRSPLSDCTRKSSAGPDSGQLSLGGSKRIIDSSSLKGSSARLESFKQENTKVTKIEERLTSGARVIIQSNAPCDESEDSSSS